MFGVGMTSELYPACSQCSVRYRTNDGRNAVYFVRMKDADANQRERLQKDYADARADYAAASTVIVKRMEDARKGLDATPTSAEVVAEKQARKKLVAARRRVCQVGAQYLESLPIG